MAWARMTVPGWRHPCPSTSGRRSVFRGCRACRTCSACSTCRTQHLPPPWHATWGVRPIAPPPSLPFPSRSPPPPPLPRFCFGTVRCAPSSAQHRPQQGTHSSGPGQQRRSRHPTCGSGTACRAYSSREARTHDAHGGMHITTPSRWHDPGCSAQANTAHASDRPCGTCSFLPCPGKHAWQHSTAGCAPVTLSLAPTTWFVRSTPSQPAPPCAINTKRSSQQHHLVITGHR